MADALGNLPRRLVAELMTGGAAAGLQVPDPLGLALDVRRNTIAAAAGAGELALVRHAEQRQPITRRIVFRRRAWIRRDHRLQVEDLPRRGLHLWRVDEAVAADPHGVGGFREIRKEVASAIVCHDNLGKLRRQLCGFRDHPYARFRSRRAGDDSADVVSVDADRVAGPLAGAAHRQRGRKDDEPDHHGAHLQHTCHRHNRLRLNPRCYGDGSRP